VLQHAPGRTYFEDLEHLQRRIPSARDEIELIARYGARVLAVCVNGSCDDGVDFQTALADLRGSVDVPVLNPLGHELQQIVPILREFVAQQQP
jgi:uncharacterized NAD-dependent epimerase/dehydratase family protein